MNFCQLRKEHSGLCDWRNLQKGALRNEKQPKRKHFLLNVPYPVIYRTPLKNGAWQTVWLTKLTKGRTKKRNTETSSSKAKTGAKAKRQRPETESCIRAVVRMQLSSVCTLLPHMLRSCANDNYTQIKGEKKKLYKLYTDPTFNLAFRWFTARYEMYSLCFKLYTNYT